MITRNWPYYLLMVSLVASAAWGVTQYQGRASAELVSDNSQQMSFHELAGHVEGLEDALARVLAGATGHVEQLDEVRFHARGAAEHLGHLSVSSPLRVVPAWLSELTAFTQALSSQVRSGLPLSQVQLEQVRRFYDEAVLLEGELDRLASTISAARLRWPVARLSQLDEVLPVASGAPGSGAFTPEEPAPAFAAVAQFFAREGGLAGEPVLVGESERFWYVDAVKATGVEIHAGVSKQTRQLVWFLDGRPIGRAEWTQADASAQAIGWLQGLYGGTFEVVEYEAYEGVAVVTAVPVEAGVLLYPDQVLLRIALDNGELLGYEATDYWVNHRPRELAAPALAEGLARQRVRFAVASPGRQALVKVGGEERLAWEFTGATGANRFKAFIDAASGEELALVRLPPEASGH